METDDGTLPAVQYVADTPFVYRTIMEKYKFKHPKDEIFNWLMLVDTPIDESDVARLVRGISFWYEGHHVARVDTGGRGHRYKCEICKRFVLDFKAIKRPGKEQVYLLNMQKSVPIHELMNHRDQSFRGNNRKDPGLLLDSRVVLDTLKAHFNEISPSQAFKKVIDRVREIGYDGSQITSSAFGRWQVWLRALYRKEQTNLYSLLPTYLQMYAKLNSKSTVALQVDKVNSFFRMFITVPHAKTIFEKFCLPALHIDSVNHKTPMYDGKLILIVATSGNGSTILLGAAWVPTDDARNYLFVIKMLEQAGLDFSKFPVFTEQAKFMGAAIHLQARKGTTISLKYSLEHVIGNIRAKFNFHEAEVILLRSALLTMQCATTIDAFLSAAQDMETKFGLERAHKILCYLMQGVHPRHWAVIGNLSTLEDSEWEPQYYNFLAIILGLDVNWTFIKEHYTCDPVPPGNKFPLFGHCRYNVAKVAETIVSRYSIPNVPPPYAMKIFLTVAMQQNRVYFSEVRSIYRMTTDGAARKRRIELDDEEKPTQSEIASKLYDAAIKEVPNLKVLEAEKKDDVYSVSVSTGSDVYNVTIDDKLKAKCTCHQYGLYTSPCSHIIGACQWLSMSREYRDTFTHETARDVIQASLPPWADINAMNESLGGMQVYVPFEWQNIRLVHTDQMINPPPSYNKSSTTNKGGRPKGSKSKTAKAKAASTVAAAAAKKGDEGDDMDAEPEVLVLDDGDDDPTTKTVANGNDDDDDDKATTAAVIAAVVEAATATAATTTQENDSKPAATNRKAKTPSKPRISPDDFKHLTLMTAKDSYNIFKPLGDNSEYLSMLGPRADAVRFSRSRKVYCCVQCGSRDHTVGKCIYYLRNGRSHMPISSIEAGEFIVLLVPAVEDISQLEKDLFAMDNDETTSKALDEISLPQGCFARHTQEEKLFVNTTVISLQDDTKLPSGWYNAEEDQQQQQHMAATMIPLEESNNANNANNSPGNGNNNQNMYSNYHHSNNNNNNNNNHHHDNVNGLVGGVVVGVGGVSVGGSGNGRQDEREYW